MDRYYPVPVSPQDFTPRYFRHLFTKTSQVLLGLVVDGHGHTYTCNVTVGRSVNKRVVHYGRNNPVIQPPSLYTGNFRMDRRFRTERGMEGVSRGVRETGDFREIRDSGTSCVTRTRVIRGRQMLKTLE